MCKFMCCSSAAMLVLLMTVDAFAARPRGSRGRPGPARRPAVDRSANPSPRVAPPAVRNPNQFNRNRSPQPGSYNAHPTPYNAPGTARYPDHHPDYNPNIKPFTPAWYAHHPRTWWATHPYRPLDAVTWVGLSRWVGLDTAPVLYDYNIDGSEEVIVYTDGVSDTKNPFAVEENTADVQVDEMETDWFPLGMFSLVPPGNTDGIAMLQLAIGKDGEIRGTYQDVMTNSVYPLSGSLDKKTQKVSWNLDANKAVVYETGLHNLTEPITALMVRFGDQKKQKWTMRRVDVEKPKHQ